MSKLCRITVCVVCLVFVVSLPGANRSPVTKKAKTAVARPTAFVVRELHITEDRILAALDDQTEMQFIDTPLQDAIQYFGELHNIPIIIDQSALGEEGIANDEPVNVVLAGVRLRSALKIILKPLDLTYVVEDEVLKITSIAAVESRVITRVYAMHSFEKAGFDADSMAEAIARTIRPESWKPAVTSVSLLSDGKTIVLKDDDRTLELWDGSTGKRMTGVHDDTDATITTLPGCLIVRQSVIAQQEIEELLRVLALVADVRL